MAFSMILSVFGFTLPFSSALSPFPPSLLRTHHHYSHFPPLTSYYPLSRMVPFHFPGFCSYFMLYTHSWRPTNERGRVTLSLCAWVTPLSIFSVSSSYPQISWFRFTLQINISLYACTSSVIDSSFERQLGCFHFLTTVSWMAMSIAEQASVE